MANPKHHIYFVHGIGVHSKTWLGDYDDSSTLKDTIAEAWKPLCEGSMEDNLDLVSICYDDVYDKLYDQWEDEVAKLRLQVGPLDVLGFLKPLLDAAAAPSAGTADNKFFYTHTCDLLWYWGNSLVQNLIVRGVTAQIMADVNKHYGDSTHTFSIVAHSMGTSVIHKVLQDIYGAPKYKELSENLKFKVIMQVANCSYALSADRDGHYSTLVKPSAYADRGVCDFMINVGCRYDPISEVIPFSPPDEWIDAKTQHEGRYIPIRKSKITSINVHSIVHYFKDPLVHATFFERVTDVLIDSQKKDDAFRKFEEATIEGEFKSIKAKYENLIATSGKSAPEFIVAIANFMKVIGAHV